MDKDEIVIDTFISKKKISLLMLIFIFILSKNLIYHIKIKIFYFIHNKNRRVVTKGPNELINIFTQWGSSLKKDNILQEYPRPQFKRNSYLNLNGEWDYSLNRGIEKPKFKRKIIVPFPIESPLSGVKKKNLQPGMKLWYRKIVDLTKIKNNGRFLLHFGAVDQFTEVLINKNKVGEHDGGYTSFYFDITNYINKNLDKTEIIVKVKDNYSKDGAAFGKQGKQRTHTFYAKTGGIWQTVWIESVPKTYIKNVKITPRYDEPSVTFLMTIKGKKIKNYKGNVKILDKEHNLIKTSQIIPNIETKIKMPDNFRSWSPEEPYLYKVEYIYGKDIVKSYFGMRKFSIGLDKKKIKRLFLNNKPYFHKGVLDQGYWSDGYITAPSDEAIVYDIQTMKDLGFNMLRKHIKIEPKRWYYHCDTIGMIVWQDQPSGGTFPFKHFNHTKFIKDNEYKKFSRENKKGRKNFVRDLERTIDQLYNTPSISTWVPFNEGWGQFDSIKIAKKIKSLDKTRFVDHTSGWVDQNGLDFKSIHIYNKEIKFKPDKLNRPIVLSEFGGFGRIIKNHVGCQRKFSYIMYDTKLRLTKGIKNLLKYEVYPNIEKGLCASVYTQLSDIEEEVNGFLTYDRKIVKVDKKIIKEVNDLLKLE
jgi:hypothetical protein